MAEFRLPPVPGPHDGYKIACMARNGDHFLLAGHGPGGEKHQRIVLLEDGFNGGVAAPEIATIDHPWGMGLVQSGHLKFGEMTGSLDVVAWSDHHDAGEHFRDWRAMWLSTLPLHPMLGYRPIRLEVTHRDGLGVWTPAVLAEVPGAPAHDPARARFVEDSISWKSLEGCWFAPPRRYSGTVTVTPVGDVPPRCHLVWDGQNTYLKTPFSSRVDIPAAGVGGPYRIDLERGMSGKVSIVDGPTVPSMWAKLRGRIQGVSLFPHIALPWDLGPGLELVVEPRYFTPWR